MSKEGTGGEPLAVVSPHPDDAAYSVGGMLAAKAFARQVFGVTVFTRSQALTYGEPALSRTIAKPLNLLSSHPRVNRPRQSIRFREVTRLRKREDASYYKAIGAPRIDLDLLDAPLRGYSWSPLASDMATVRKDPLLGKLVPIFNRIISSLIKAGNPMSEQASDSGHDLRRCVMLLPLGLGGHVDHMLVREACSGVSGDHVSIYYEDLPYSESLTEEQIVRTVGDFDSQLEPHFFNIGASLARKIENLRLYKTQVGDKEVGHVIRYANRLGEGLEPCERLWYRPLAKEIGLRKSLERTEYFPQANPFSKAE